MTSLHARVRRAAQPLRYAGFAVACPCCGGRFRRFADGHSAPGIACPRCASYPRHRLLWLYLTRDPAALEGAHVLHMAPEPCLIGAFARVATASYVTADIESPLADRRVDITAMDFADDSFDLTICSHVLEHVPDDRRAMRELRRTLRPGGRALLQHPIVPGQATFEDPTVTDPAERLRLFSQEDHVRVYGPDIEDRLRSVGFDVEVVRHGDLATPAELRRYGLREPLYPKVLASDVYVCRKERA